MKTAKAIMRDFGRLFTQAKSGHPDSGPPVHFLTATFDTTVWDIFSRPSQKSPHLLAQLPTLHKSVSTPSIVVEPSGSSTKSGQST